MGHLHNADFKEEYRNLVRRLEAGSVAMPEPTDPRAWQGWREVLEILFTPEEAALAARIPVLPTTLARLASDLEMEPGDLKARLEPMCDRGVVMDIVHPRTGETRYLLSPPVIGFFEFSMMRAHDAIPKKRMAEALHAYMFGDQAFAREVFGGETVIGRALVHESVLDDDMPEVLDHERATTLVREARSWAVALCYCRHEADHLGEACDAPRENCLSLNAGADFIVRRKFGRAVTAAEALDLLSQARDHGLVHVADNVLRRPTYICNCCGCCCRQLGAINHFNLPAVSPSGFLARCREEACVGCGRCSRACPIAAISMQPHRLAGTPKNTLKPSVDADRCIGCGVCAGACHKDAMGMVRRENPRAIPANSVEKTLRMAVERGHLGRLLYEEGTRRGPAFLYPVVKILMGLPGVDRVLASKQVGSRFLQVALRNVRDPTGG